MLVDIVRRIEAVEAGGTRELTVRLYELRQEGVDWSVAVSVHGIEERFEAPRRVFGADPIQCLLLATVVAHGVLAGSAPGRAGQIPMLNAPEMWRAL